MSQTLPQASNSEGIACSRSGVHLQRAGSAANFAALLVTFGANVKTDHVDESERHGTQVKGRS